MCNVNMGEVIYCANCKKKIEIYRVDFLSFEACYSNILQNQLVIINGCGLQG